jgi:hypothetical protein
MENNELLIFLLAVSLATREHSKDGLEGCSITALVTNFRK